MGQVAQEVLAGEPGQRPQHEPGRQCEELQADPAGLEHRPEQDPHRVVVEHVEDPVRRAEEVERVGGGRRIEHHHVEAARFVQLVHLLHRHVLEAARHRRGELLVEAVLQDLPGALGRGRLPLHQFVPGELQVEHHGVHLAARAQSGGAEQLVLDAGLSVAERLEPQAVRQPARRIDGEHQGTLPRRRHAQRERRRRGRLPHSAGSHAGHHPAPREDLIQRRAARGHELLGPPHSASSMAWATFSIACGPKERSNRYGTGTSGSCTSLRSSSR